MNTIYTKYTDYRRPRFRIMTSIVEDDGSRSVIKRTAPGGEAGAHLARMVKNAVTLQNLYQDRLKVCPCTQKGRKVVFPFVEGTSYLEHLREAARTGGRTAFLDLLQGYVDFLEGPPENHIPFQETEAFREIFGSYPELAGVPALALSNLDASPDNIIEDAAGNWNLIDYEWVFDFPIPRDLIIFRHLHFLTAERGFALFSELTLEELLKIFNVRADLDLLLTLHAAFQRYVCVEKGSALSEEEIFLRHLKPMQDMREAAEAHNTHFVFLDTGRGFNEQEKLLFPTNDEPLHLQIDTRGVMNLRFDPFEGQRTLADHLKFVTDTGHELPFEAPDLLSIGERTLLNQPANVTVAVPPETAQVVISGSVLRIHGHDEQWLDQTVELTEQISSLATQLAETAEALAAIREIHETEKARADISHDMAIRERDQQLTIALAQIRALEGVLRQTHSSGSWKLTRWLRELKSLIRKTQ